MIMIRLFLLCFVVFVKGDGYEGDSCSISGERGICTLYTQCQSAKEAFLENRIRPQICSWSGRDAIVCCLDGMGNRQQGQSVTTTAKTTTTTTKATTTTTTEYVPPIPQYDDEVDNVCPAIAANLTAQRIGRKAWDKCVDYQESYVYPCGRSMALSGGMVRLSNCKHSTDPLILGGQDATALEYPHMVLLGFLEAPKSVSWDCAGTIISERYVLTAAHCTVHRNLGEVRFIRAGALTRSAQYELRQLYMVKEVMRHPQYASPVKYHDIALLKTDRAMELGLAMVPACLDTGTGVDYDKGIVTGWGLTKQGGRSADKLQWVILQKFTAAQCRRWYPVGTRNMEGGYQDDSQICYGDSRLLQSSNDKPAEYKDACQGDSGGPIQVKNSLLNCMYTVIGITSFGKGCGNDAAGIYTRVSKYVPWIESVVWPDDARTSN